VSKPAARIGDVVTGTDTHIVLVPSAGGPVPTPYSLPFNGRLTQGGSRDVLVGGAPAATVGTTATNLPPHVAPTGTFQVPPTNRGTVVTGSATVLVNGRPAARHGDQVLTCNDPVPAPVGTIRATGTVLIGG
jgi:uncharacterized Zn-binding protein involved in type VI secretion